ncbi:MAG: pantoate--beta-alanine ligase [Candidatus Melainabacteria bacterium]|nr:pantoate--beta-alanine ligase [Candidatus Melainabacteria bacterium]
MTILIKTKKEIKDKLLELPKPIGLVPTMGALHAGHISLIQAAQTECKTVIVYIFVNPLQFGPDEDYEKYPRDLESDLKICEQNKVDIAFAPSVNEIYPEMDFNEETISPPVELTNILCGKTRVNHFNGVATVINKFFNIIQPDYAYFGKKDFQQLCVIKWLVHNYKHKTNIKACPTIREKSGLACSSRNKYLKKDELEIASNLYKSLKMAKANLISGMFSVQECVLESLVFLSQFLKIKVEYFEARQKDTLVKIKDNYELRDFHFFVAAKVGNVRLIDNIEIQNV